MEESAAKHNGPRAYDKAHHTRLSASIARKAVKLVKFTSSSVAAVLGGLARQRTK